MKYIIGIGNSDAKYEGTRHNIGFAIVEAIKRPETVKWDLKKNFKAFVAELPGDIWLIRSTMFVNGTDGTISALPPLVPQNYFVVCDDVNMQFGKMRLRASGSAGGHHGLESIIRGLGSEDFPRLRVGIKNENMPQDLTGFVLGLFTGEERKELSTILKKAASVSEAWFLEGFEAAQSRLSQLQSIT